jgi:hypothetical protein
LGKASVLMGCAELIEAMPVPWLFDAEAVRARGGEIADELLTLLSHESAASQLAAASGFISALFSQAIS